MLAFRQIHRLWIPLTALKHNSSNSSSFNTSSNQTFMDVTVCHWKPTFRGRGRRLPRCQGDADCSKDARASSSTATAAAGRHGKRWLNDGQNHVTTGQGAEICYSIKLKFTLTETSPKTPSDQNMVSSRKLEVTSYLTFLKLSTFHK